MQPAESAQLIYELPPLPSGSASASGSSPFTRMPNGSFGGGLSRARITVMQYTLVPARTPSADPTAVRPPLGNFALLEQDYTCS